MAGATGSGQEMETGRTNRAEGRTILWADVPPGQANFNGPAILIVEVAKDAEDPDDYDEGESFIPSNQFHGIIGTGWSGGGPSNFGGTPGGTGVVGLGGGSPEPGNGGAGGIGVHGLGGPQAEFFADPTTPPGAGVVGQGGRQPDNNNRTRLPHAPGVIGLGGGIGRTTDLLPAHPLAATGGVGVYGQGAEQTVTQVVPVDETESSIPGPNVPSGPLAPGAGVLGRGGVPIPPGRPVGAGVIGLAGDTAIPGFSETGDIGVYGAGRTGVVGHGPIGVRGRGEAGPGVEGVGRAGSSRGGQFESTHAAQVQLVPHETGKPTPPSTTVTPSALTTQREEGVQLPRDGRGGDLLTLIDNQRQCTLWFCMRGADGGPARWAQVLLGPSFDGQA